MRRQRFSKIVGILVVALLAITAVFYTGATVEAAGEINLMTWGGDFIPRAIIREFEEETGIKVNYKEVTSNEDMQSLLEANPGQYDLAVTTDYMVDILRQTDMLAVLDKSQLPNYANINPVYHGAYYDPTDEYSIPYAISISLLLANPGAVEALGADPITSYHDLWQKELVNNVVVVDWSVEIMGVVLKSLGYEYNETDPVKVAEAREKLFALKPNIMRFETNTPEDSLVNGEAVAGFMYSNQAVKGVQTKPELAPVFPTEGMPIFIDSWVMSKAAPNKDGAYQFLNFIMRPEIAARIADLTKFTSPNKAAEEYLPEDFKNNPMLNLADEVVENTSFYIGVEKVLDEYEHIYLEFKLR
ncbi:MAG: spermidine/putrescine ABC transporter substrate-binding protein [Limnochordia bacterium]|jgi:spermidine/putrescine transport system substrate-binding protein|nr:spermidine/putrescine ABC transporter substrate-binding protein [Limnochordia bacterium]